jgi:hypothetical protein
MLMNFIQSIKEEKKNKKFNSCNVCGKKYLKCYWDYEIESYIFVREGGPCFNCEVEAGETIENI